MTHPTLHRISPVPGLGLEGYADEISVASGDEVQFMAGAPAETDAEASVVRLVHGDPSPAGPGYKDEPVDWDVPERVTVEPQATDYGSYVEIPHADALAPVGGFTFALWLLPTRVAGGWHAVAAKWAPGDLGWGLWIMGDHVLTAAISFDGVTAEWCTGREFLQRRWLFAAVTYDPEPGEVAVYQWAEGTTDPRRRGRIDPLAAARKRLRGGPVHASRAPLLLGAALEAEPGRHWAHFNGKLAGPVLLGEALDEDGVRALPLGEDPASLATVLGRWDLSQEVSGHRVVDVSGRGNDGVAVNMPARAVTGPRWRGYEGRLYSEAPEDYDAIHLHEDDLDDAGWKPTFSLRVPPGARSGVYAARLEAGADRLFLPFVVRSRAPSADVLFLAHTLTWLAYSSNRQPYSATEDGVLDRGSCLYDVHSDGSLVYYATRRKPTRSGNPTAGFPNWGAHTIPAALYLVDWLEEKEFPYDVAAEEDLHAKGAELLRSYRVTILGSHPEYWTERMLDGLEAYLQSGGRVLYLGGNGLWWVTSVDPERPWLVEARKDGITKAGSSQPETWILREPGERQHSITLEVGGRWTDRARPARSLLGLETAGNAFWHAEGRWGFGRLPTSFDSRYAFAFEGVGSHETIGDFGLNLGSAAAFEFDGVHEWRWHHSEPVVLARAQHESFFAARTNPSPPRADVALMLFPNGGAVFAAGSVAWTGSLSHAGYDNNVSRITENVLRRFLEAPPGASVLDEAGS